MNARYSVEFTPTVSDQPEWWRITLERDGRVVDTIEGPMPDADIENLHAMLMALFLARQDG